MADRVLVDSDAFVGWIVTTDAHHQRVTAAFDRLKGAQVQPITTNLVIAETASLLSRRHSQPQAKGFLEFSQHIETIYITQQLHQYTTALFLDQDRKNVSFVDLANVVIARAYGIGEILSFDKTYPKDFNLKLWEGIEQPLR
jgi:predicted nucleic acid-binding protein